MILSDLELRKLCLYGGLEIILGKSIGFPKISENMHGLMPSMSRKSFMPPSKSINIKSIINPIPKKMNPSGFDLSLIDCIKESNILYHKLTQERFEKMNPSKINGERHIFQNNIEGKKVYYVLTKEKINLPRHLEMIVDGCSTTGRVSCLVNGVGQMRNGRQILAIQPLWFPIEITFGKTILAQAVIRYKGTYFVHPRELKKIDGIELLLEGENVFEKNLIEKGLIMTLSSNLIYKAIENKEPIDMDVKEEIDPKKYFEIIRGNKEVHMEAGAFYLASTREKIRTGNFCGMLSRTDHISGAATLFNLAGIIHPGYYGGITLECISFYDRVFEEGHPIGIVTFDKIKGKIENGYQGFYNDQPNEPVIPKMFEQKQN